MTTTTAVVVSRRAFVKALEHALRVLPSRNTKAILQSVKLEASEGSLRLAVTDMETSLTLKIPCEGELPRTVVSCRDLLQRVRTGRGPQCEISLNDEALIVNGGAVHHRISTSDPAEYPIVIEKTEGRLLRVNGGQLKGAIRTALVGVARDQTRYAINGVNLEVAVKVHVVATDGRRLVTTEIDNFQADAEFNVILPVRFCQMLIRLIEQEDDCVDVHVDQANAENAEKSLADVSASGPGWVLHSLEMDGQFPLWREIVPRDGSRFMLDRTELLSLVREVGMASGEDSKGIQLRLGEDRLAVSCRSGAGGGSTGAGFCRFLGGGDSLILTGFNPGYLEDALSTLAAPKVIVHVQQNVPTGREGVAHRPAVFSNWPSSATQWVIMPVNTGIPQSHESLGSNFCDSQVA